MLFGDFLILWLMQVFIFVLGISLGHAITILRIRREENRKRELEIALLEKREDILMKGKKIATDLEEVLYKARVAQEIDNIVRKDKPAKP
jgi:hypothetical protein